MFSIGKSRLEEASKEQLIPFVVVRIMTLHHTVPIIGKSHSLDLFGNRSHVSLGNIVRMAAFSNGRVFCRHSKRIKAHGIENIEPFHSLISSNCITDGIISNVTHMHLSRWVWIHFKTVEFGFRSVIICNEDLCVIPCLLPCNFIGRFTLVRHHHHSLDKPALLLSFFNPPQQRDFRRSTRCVKTLHLFREGTLLPS